MTKAFQSDSYQFHQPLCCSTADFLNCTCHRAWTRSVSNNTSLTAAMHHTDHAHKQSQSMQTMRTKNWRRSASGRWRSACWRRWRRASSAMTLGWCQATEAAVTQCNKFAYYLWIVFYYRTAVQNGSDTVQQVRLLLVNSILLQDSCSKRPTDFFSLIFSRVYCVVFQTLFNSFVCSLLLRPIFIHVVFCLLWYDTWSCGLSCFLLNEYVMLC